MWNSYMRGSILHSSLTWCIDHYLKPKPLAIVCSYEFDTFSVCGTLNKFQRFHSFITFRRLENISYVIRSQNWKKEKKKKNGSWCGENDFHCNHVFNVGFQNSDSPCCSFGRIRPALTCLPASRLCKDRSKYVFWDEYHPTDSANQLIANELIKKFGFLRVDPTGAPSPSPTVAPSSDVNEWYKVFFA